MKPACANALWLVVMLLAVPVNAWAQTPAAGTAERTYGTTSNVIHPMAAAGFVPIDSSVALSNTGGLWRTCPFGTCRVIAGASLPAGAVVTRIELDACINPGGPVTTKLLRSSRTDSSAENILVSLSTDEIDVVPPACTSFPKNLPSPAVIDNANNYYVVEVNFPGNPEAVFGGVRLHHHLQVSPAPAVATFNDVPTSHPFFPFVQALVAAGITSGCNASPPMYCPDQAVTRGQMAKFLSTALGLHFAP